MDDDIEDVTFDSSELIGRPKKKKGLASVIAKKANTDRSGSPKLNALEDSPSDLRETSQSTKDLSKKDDDPVPNSNIERSIKLPSLRISSSSQNVTDMSSNGNLHSADDTNLPVNPNKIISQGSPKLAQRAKLGTSITDLSHQPEKNNVHLKPGTPTSGELRKSTPRPLPAHVKQAFASPAGSFRNSLRTSNNLTEELIKTNIANSNTTAPSDSPNAANASVSILRKISCRDVKRRSYLVGSLGSQLSFGNKPELEYYFPDRHIRIYAGTWNMSGIKTLPQQLEDFIIPDYASNGLAASSPDIFAFGTQESMSDRRQWLVALQENLGQHYVCLCCPSFGTLGLAIFIRRELIWFVSCPFQSNSFPKPYKPIATKGSVAVSFDLFGTSLLFINSHFSAGDGNVDARVEDYKRSIVDLKVSVISQNKSDAAKMKSPSSPGGPSGFAGMFGSRRVASASVPSTPEQTNSDRTKRPISADDFSNPRDTSNPDFTSHFDCVIWMGDFNFRVTRERHHIDKVIESYHASKNTQPNSIRPMTIEEVDDLIEPVGATNSYEVLLEHDEMSREMSNGRLFSGFSEGRIRFMPTYKFDVGTNTYDTSSKLRIQSYTDRIVFRCRRKNTITCVAYSSVESVVASDHKPLYGVYDVELRPGLDALPSGAGHFEHGIYMDGLKRRAQLLTSDKQSAVCSIQ